jgi:ubiquinone/menaquinone biosynthesis C-methylase UbiE
VISDFLKAVARCPACGSKKALEASRAGLRCSVCGRSYPALAEEGYLDLRPPEKTFSDLTDYAEEEFHHRAGALRPLFLSARVKMDVMKRMLAPRGDDAVLDIGCGNGRFIYFEQRDCKTGVGIDAGAHFAEEALKRVDLARGDIRALPFADESFDKAYSLDVLEHLTEEGVRQMLSEARRVLKPGGKLFLYSHVMMSSRLASFQRGVNRLVRWLDERGIVDNEPERERKSDHRNALRSYEQLGRILDETGFAIDDIRYYNVFFKAIFEDLLLPVVEQNFFPKSSVTPTDDNHDEGDGDHDHHASTKPDVGRWAHAPLSLATYLMKLDVALFGRVKTGPFFLLLRAI